MRAQMRLIGHFASRIDNQEQMVTAMRNHQIVDDAARFICEQRITLAAGCQAKDIDRHQLLKGPRRIGHLPRVCAQSDLPHVRNIEKAR